MKKVIYGILIIVLIAIAWFLFNSRSFVFQNRDQEGLKVEDQTIPTGAAKEETASWLDYKNSDYKFQMEYPDDWEAQVALKPQQPKAQDEIVFSQQNYDVFRASLTVRLYPNQERKSLESWWQAWLSEEDKKKEECKAEDEMAPCLHLRDLLRKEESATIADQPALLIRLFRFDSEEECLFTAHENYIYSICYDGVNPNDPNFESNQKIIKQMVESFGFYKPPVSANTTSSDLVGKWQSIDDPSSSKIFKSGGVIEDVYQGKVLSTGKWQIVSEDEFIAATGSGTATGEDKVFLEVEAEGEKYFYLVLDVTDTDLTLSYLPRGNILNFKKGRE